MSEASHRRPGNSLFPICATAFVAIICSFGELGAIGLVGPDEPRYAWIARAMAQTGDWITPRLYGQPWFEKPVLYYWAAAFGFRLHLSPEWATRLPSAFAALAASLAIGWLAWKHYDRDTSSFSRPALLAPLLFSTSVAAIGFARAATPDMLFSASIALAMASAACDLRRAEALRSVDPFPAEHGRALLPLVLFGAFLGLAVLAKGPAGVVLAGGAISLWALVTKQWRTAFRLAHPLAIAAFCVVALPWYVLCALRNPDFLRVFIFQHNFERYLTPMFQHRQPFWYFGPILFLALLPWTVLLWPVAEEGLRLWRERSWTSSSGFFFACWAIIPVAFFSFSQSKLPGYILPAIPPLALVCAIGLARAFQASRTTAVGLAAGIAGTWFVLALVVYHTSRRIRWDDLMPAGDPHPLRVLGLTAFGAIALIAAALILAGYVQSLSYVVGLCVVCVLFSLEFVSPRILSAIDPLYSARPHAEFLKNDQYPDRIFTYQLSRSWNYGLAFYFRRELPEWSPSDPEAALVLTTPAGLQEISRLGRLSGSLDEPYVGILLVPIQRIHR